MASDRTILVSTFGICILAAGIAGAICQFGCESGSSALPISGIGMLLLIALLLVPLILSRKFFYNVHSGDEMTLVCNKWWCIGVPCFLIIALFLLYRLI